MNLAILITKFPPGVVGGAEIQAQEWARRLSDRHRVTVITRRDPPNQAERESRDGFAVQRLPRSPLPVWRTWANLRDIEGAVGALEPRPDLLLCFQTFASGYAGVRVQRRFGIPAVVWIRGEMEYRVSASWRARLFGPPVWRRAAAVLVQTEEIRMALLNELAHVRPSFREPVARHLQVVPNGIELPQGPFELGDRVLCVGRLIENKGMDTAIDAVAAVKGRLTIAGDGPMRKALEERASRLGLDARFEGIVDRDRLSALYREARCVVLAARRGEGMPNVLLEAMAHARPVVTTPVAGITDLVVDGVNGLLVPPDEPSALSGALLRLEREPGLAERLAASARLTAARFGWESARPRLEAVLERYKAASP
jgi:glycosyltransferase involved in cell wall biosynthesis